VGIDQNKWIEYYKCLILTVIVLVLLGLLFNRPMPYTLRNIREKKVSHLDIPVVYVRGGNMTVDGSVGIES
jgi:hypothetical protein